MSNFFRVNKKINFDPYTPQYMKDEEVYEFMKVFEDFLNELYDVDKEVNYKNVIANISPEDIQLDGDTADTLFSWGGRTPNQSATNPTIGVEDWDYDSTYPSVNQLDPGDDYPNITNLSYRNTEPPQSAKVNIFYPWRGIDIGRKISEHFDYRAPMNILSTTDYSITIPVYNCVGLYNASFESLSTVDTIPDFTEYYRSGYASTDVIKKIYKTDDNGNDLTFLVPNYYQPSDELWSESITTKELEAGSAVNVTSKISVLEKISRISDLKDPRLMDIEFLQYFANYLGWDMNLTLDDFNSNDVYSNKYKTLMTEDERSESIMDHMRAFIENTPWWYRIKGSEESIKIILFTFGLVADIIKYYTEDYSTNVNMWKTADTFFNDAYYQVKDNRRDEITEEFTDIPDSWFPTPHFQARYSINDSFSKYTKIFYDDGRFSKLMKAIDAIKPITTVFEGLVGLFRTNHSYMTTIYSIAVPLMITRTTDGSDKADAYGTLENRSLYDDREVGFKYLVIDVDTLIVDIIYTRIDIGGVISWDTGEERKGPILNVAVDSAESFFL